MTLAINLFPFNKPADLSDYWIHLVECQLDYHLDEDPDTVVFSDGITKEQRDVLQFNHDALWLFAENNQIQPWDRIDLGYAPESIRKKALSDFVDWLILRQVLTVRKVIVQMWIEKNYPDYQHSDSFTDYLFNHYSEFVELIPN